jgi:hypothetical protein
MGRLVGSPFFSTPDCVALEKLNAQKERQARKESEDPDRIRAVRVQLTRSMQGKMGGRILRRGATSKDNNGTSLIELPEHQRHMALLNLSPRESKALNKIAESVKAT